MDTETRSSLNSKSFLYTIRPMHLSDEPYFINADAGRSIGTKSFVMAEQQPNLDQMSEKAIKLLQEIGCIWKKLQNEPDKTTLGLNYSVIWSPSAMSYWHEIESLEKKLIILSEEMPNLVSNVFGEFLHTKDKECSYVIDFQPNKKKKDIKNKEDLANLMRKANSHIYSDLYSILKLVNQEDNK